MGVEADLERAADLEQGLEDAPDLVREHGSVAVRHVEDVDRRAARQIPQLGSLGLAHAGEAHHVQDGRVALLLDLLEQGEGARDRIPMGRDAHHVDDAVLAVAEVVCLDLPEVRHQGDPGSSAAHGLPEQALRREAPGAELGGIEAALGPAKAELDDVHPGLGGGPVDVPDHALIEAPIVEIASVPDGAVEESHSVHGVIHGPRRRTGPGRAGSSPGCAGRPPPARRAARRRVR